MSKPCENCGADIKVCQDCDFYNGKYEERKTGRWEFVSYGDGLGNYHCSECRAIASSYFVGNLVNRHWEYKLTKYCPNCGAKMKGAEE